MKILSHILYVIILYTNYIQSLNLSTNTPFSSIIPTHNYTFHQQNGYLPFLFPKETKDILGCKGSGLSAPAY